VSDSEKPQANPAEKTMIQQPLPLAFVHGEALVEKPEDLFIPPDALEVILETFEGPLDLLLYLIRKQKIDIVDLPILEITKQYMEYVELMQEVKLELAAEYMLMAAILAEIKSRLLLPKPPAAEEDEIDPRTELIRRLKEYEIIKHASQELDALPRMGRDRFVANASPAENIAPEKIHPHVAMADIVLAFAEAMQRAEAFAHHQIEREQLSTRERMSQILQTLKHDTFMALTDLFSAQEGKAGCVVSFLAILELTKEGLLECMQADPLGVVNVRLKAQLAVEDE
jgi:segregation and condensation protein A